MQVFPHGWPLLHRLQQDFCASSIEVAGLVWTGFAAG
jgi:hypothetical protein